MDNASVVEMDTLLYVADICNPPPLKASWLHAATLENPRYPP
jgi:hypothetical protein